MRSSEFSRSTTQTRATALDDLVHAGTAIGVLGYLDGEPVGWCSVAPRETCEALERYRAAQTQAVLDHPDPRVQP